MSEQNEERAEERPEERNPIDIITENILYVLWYSVAENIFKKVCEVTELDKEQIAALRIVALRPNDFRISIE